MELRKTASERLSKGVQIVEQLELDDFMQHPQPQKTERNYEQNGAAYDLALTQGMPLFQDTPFELANGKKEMNENNAIAFDLSTEGLEPLKHRILGIMVITSIEELIFTNRDEKKLLEDFWAYIIKNNFNKIVGFNSHNFDVPMLIIRCIKHKINIPNLKGKLIDTRKIIFGNQENRKGSLDDFRELLGIQFTESRFNNMHLSLLWDSSYELPKLKEFLFRDAKVTWELYKNLEGVGLI